MSSTALTVQTPPVPDVVPAQAHSDAHLLEIWLHGKSENTRDAYGRDVLQFLRFAGVPIPEIRLGDLQRYDDHLASLGRATATRARKLAVIKSLLSFAQKTGYLRYNAGAAARVPRGPDRLAERILAESAVQRMIALEEDPRNHALLRVFYTAGARVSEICALKVRSLEPRTDPRSGLGAGQMTLYGKGGKTRTVLLSPETWAELQALIRDAGPDDPVFRSRVRKHGGHLTRAQVRNIVGRAARRAGIRKPVSPHWLRHAHASHALDRGAPPHLVRETLGHASLATTSRYSHARPDQSSSQYLGM